jgi:DSF synthase
MLPAKPEKRDKQQNSGRRKRGVMVKKVNDPLLVSNDSPGLKVVKSLSVGQSGGAVGHADNLARLVAEEPTPPNAGLIANDFGELHLEYETNGQILWCEMRPHDRPSFTHSLLSDIRELQDRVRVLHADPRTDDELRPRYLVYRSAFRDIFNLGGDLRLIGTLVRSQDREGLVRYATACIEALYPNIVSLNSPLVTVSLVQGAAFGGGFEGALSNNVVIAEEGATFGLPEILFNLFPGMGAYSLISRRIGSALAERLITSGKVHTASEMHGMGLVDEIAPVGQGESKVREFVAKQQRRFSARQAIYKVRQRYHDLEFKELADITEIWVETAINLTESDLRRIDKLAKMQDARFRKSQADAERRL